MRALLLLCILGPLTALAEGRSVLERPGVEIGLLGGWQRYTPSPSSYFSLSGFGVGGEFQYRFRNGLAVGVTATYSQACYDNAGGVSPCVTQIPVVLELAWGKSLGGLVRPWIGLGSGLGFIRWTNSAYDVEDQGYAGTGLEVIYLRIRAGIDMTIPVHELGLTIGFFVAVSLATAPEPDPTGLGNYAAHQNYAIGFRLLLVIPTGDP
jgi:hypothetical protein